MGPGKMITMEAIEWAYEQGLHGFDLAGSDDPYKLQWTDQVRERSVLRIFPRSPAGSAAWAAWAHGRPLAQNGKETVAELGSRAASRVETIRSSITTRRGAAAE